MLQEWGLEAKGRTNLPNQVLGKDLFLEALRRPIEDGRTRS